MQSHRFSFVGACFVAGLSTVACSSGLSPAGGGSGGAVGSGGSKATGSGGNTMVSTGSGGDASSSSGGVVGSGGVPTSAGSGGSGGASAIPGSGGTGTGGATGGRSAGTGGGNATGGSSTGGASGGAMASGGAGATGGRGGGSSLGGATGTAGRGGAAGTPPGDGAVKSAGCGSTAWPTSKAYTINVSYNNQSKSRSYILRIPDNYDTTHPYRLIVAYHWLGGTADNVANGGGATAKPFYALWELANGSTIFVAPQGIDPANGWADTGGPGDPHDGPVNASSTGGQDIAFTKALVAELTSKLCIDTTRILAEGFSMGGSMSYAVACAMGDVFRAVAVHSGGPMSGCVKHTKPVAYFMTHGEQDGTCTYPGYGVPELKDFSAVDGCTWPNMATSTGLPAPTGAQGTHQCVDLQGCMPAYPVRSCIFVGPHTPSSPDTGASNWIPGETWKFLSQF